MDDLHHELGLVSTVSIYSYFQFYMLIGFVFFIYFYWHYWLRYDMIRECAQKLTEVSLIYCMEPKTKKVERRYAQKYR